MSSTALLPLRSSLLVLGLCTAVLAGPAAARDLTIALSSNVNIVGGIEQGVAEVAKATGQKVDVVYFGHGTTVATNALIVGRGAETGLITTKGFRDVLELRRQKRDSLYDIQT